jgi:hypothetical protein
MRVSFCHLFTALFPIWSVHELRYFYPLLSTGSFFVLICASAQVVLFSSIQFSWLTFNWFLHCYTSNLYLLYVYITESVSLQRNPEESHADILSEGFVSAKVSMEGRCPCQPYLGVHGSVNSDSIVVDREVPYWTFRHFIQLLAFTNTVPKHLFFSCQQVWLYIHLLHSNLND